MSLWRQFTHGVRVLRNRGAADQAVADELDHYLEETAAALIAEGLPPDEARQAARLQLGNMTAIREQVRGYGWENILDTVFLDSRYALRRLASNPGFTAVSIFTLALGIGASTAIFSVLDGVLLKPLPYPHSEQLVALWHTAPGIKVCGLAAALVLTRLMKSLLFEVSPADPLTYGVVSAGLILAATLASYLPARRATRVDPVEALRAD